MRNMADELQHDGEDADAILEELGLPIKTDSAAVIHCILTFLLIRNDMLDVHCWQKLIYSLRDSLPFNTYLFHIQLEACHSRLTGEEEGAHVRRMALGRALPKKIDSNATLKENIETGFSLISCPAILQLYSGQGGNRSTKPSCLVRIPTIIRALKTACKRVHQQMGDQEFKKKVNYAFTLFYKIKDAKAYVRDNPQELTRLKITKFNKTWKGFFINPIRIGTIDCRLRCHFILVWW